MEHKKNIFFVAIGIITLVGILIISTLALQSPKQSQSKAQVNDAAQKCQADGGFVSDQASCSGEGRQVIGFLSTTGTGDAGSAQVCCKTLVAVPSLSCPEGTTAGPADSCPEGRRVAPISGDGGSAGSVCCRPDSPVTPADPDTNPPTATPTPNQCVEPETPVITNIHIDCPFGCVTPTLASTQ